MAHPGMISLDDIASRRVDVSAPHLGNRLIEIEHGFYLGATDMPLDRAVEYGSQTFPFAAMSILLEGHILPHDAGMEQLHPNAMLAISNSERRELVSTFHGSERLRNVEVFVTPEWFESTGRFGDDIEFDNLREAMLRPMRSRMLMLDPRLKQLAELALATKATGALAALRLEAWALDLLAELVSSFHDRGKTAGLSPVDRDRVQAVRHFLETEPENASSLTELARSHGVSASKLKRDFFLAFQTCVGGFANTQRLLIGKRLLEEGVSVSQAAYRIGYSHPANFSAAFKRHFGVSPRDIRR